MVGLNDLHKFPKSCIIKISIVPNDKEILHTDILFNLLLLIFLFHPEESLNVEELTFENSLLLEEILASDVQQNKLRCILDGCSLLISQCHKVIMNVE